jgi:hypothetical protein
MKSIFFITCTINIHANTTYHSQITCQCLQSTSETLTPIPMFKLLHVQFTTQVQVTILGTALNMLENFRIT